MSRRESAVAQLFSLGHFAPLIMKTLFSAPVWWSEKAVGTWPRFLFMTLAQAGGFVFVCWHDHWQSIGSYLMFGLVFPVYYLIALRGVLRELHKKDKSDERPVA